MSHFTVAVILPKKDLPYTEDQVYEVVGDLMEPYREPDGEWFADGSRWDWYVIGGRWDGAIRGLPWLEVLEECDLCLGSGHRTEKLEMVTESLRQQVVEKCNGCDGKGQRQPFSSPLWYSLERNMTLVKDMDAEYEPIAVVLPEGEWVEMHRVGWWGMPMQDEQGRGLEKIGAFDQKVADAKKKYAKHVVVGLDCHV